MRIIDQIGQIGHHNRESMNRTIFVFKRRTWQNIMGDSKVYLYTMFNKNKTTSTYFNKL